MHSGFNFYTSQLVPTFDKNEILDVYHLPKKKKQPAQTWVRENKPRIESIRNGSLLVRHCKDTDKTYYFYFHSYWSPVEKLDDFPSNASKEILTVFTLMQG